MGLDCNCDPIDLFNFGCRCRKKPAVSFTPSLCIKYVTHSWLSNLASQEGFIIEGNKETVDIGFVDKIARKPLKLQNNSHGKLVENNTKISGLIADGQTVYYVHIIMPPGLPVEGIIY